MYFVFYLVVKAFFIYFYFLKTLPVYITTVR